MSWGVLTDCWRPEDRGKGSAISEVAQVFGIPAPWIIWFFGPKLRGVSRYAAGEKALQA
jgi:hypothetical protein